MFFTTWYIMKIYIELQLMSNYNFCKYNKAFMIEGYEVMSGT